MIHSPALSYKVSPKGKSHTGVYISLDKHGNAVYIVYKGARLTPVVVLQGLAKVQALLIPRICS